MASVSKADGGWRVQFSSPDRKRRTTRLGPCTRKDADAFCVRVERLIASLWTGTPIDA